jgi:internalin A
MTKEELLKIIKQAAKDGVTTLDLSNKGITELPPEIGQLTQLTKLILWGNNLTVLPSEIGQLIHLTELEIYMNQLTALPKEIGQLTQLTSLVLFDNRLTALPKEIDQLSNLEGLILGDMVLGGNQLTILPPEIGKLTKLRSLRLEANQLIVLPLELSQLTNLEYLGLGNDIDLETLPWQEQIPEVYNNNDLEFPPPEIVKQGTKAILAYLQAQLKERQKQWLSKLIIVGQGGVGKTSLLRVLRGEPFNPEESTTHGLETNQLQIAHPSETNVTMQLNTWDFGGQQIYHATHQFFLTNRSLFLLAWHARMGFEAGKLYYWLDTLTALAPDSPVLLVATHIDEREADIPLAELRQHYPQIIGQCEISNKTGQGFETFQQAIAQAAADLPLMGETWPGDWLKAANRLRDSTENYITPQVLQDIMMDQGIDSNQQPILIQWLHDLGDMLYFPESNELEDIVILKPQWVSEYISKVLESEDVKKRGGILTRDEMKRLWHDLPATLREHFLRLMERFDLSYQDEDRAISLIVERLPLTPPAYQTQWDEMKALDNAKEITLLFKLNTLPAGIPTWLIARAHRFSINTHWRYGALFKHENHLALVQASERDSTVQLSVRGPNPPNFFALLKDGLEVTLKRFPGLKIARKIPCSGHQGQTCPHEFNYEQIVRRYEKNKRTIECPETDEDISVPELLYGWDSRTQDLVLSRLEQLGEGQDHILAKQDHITSEIKASREEIQALRELTQREFTNAFHREQANIEAHCPNVFVLRGKEKGERGKEKGGWFKAIAGETLELQLYCQAPGCWHPTMEGGLYEIHETAEWLKTIAPYLNRLISVLKYAAPLMGAWVGEEIKTQDYKKLFQRDLETTKAIAQQISNHPSTSSGPADLEPETFQGPALRALRHLLEEQDPQQQWGGLKKVLTPEGHYLWLCEHHAREYQ